MSQLGASVVVACEAGTEFAVALLAAVERRASAHSAGARAPGCRDWAFPDGEVCFEIDRDINGRDLYVVQSLASTRDGVSVNDNLMRLLAAGRACREWGARTVTAVLPALSYTRQDRVTAGRREPVTAKLVAELLATSGFSSVVAYHVADGPVRACWRVANLVSVPPEPMLTALVNDFEDADTVIVVAPDSGAAGLARRIADASAMDVATGRKWRKGPTEIEMDSIEGIESHHRTAFIVDDMIASGATLVETVRRLREHKGIEQIVVGVSHLFEHPDTIDRMRRLRSEFGVEMMHVTNTIPISAEIHKMEFVVRHDVTGGFVDRLALTSR